MIPHEELSNLEASSTWTLILYYPSPWTLNVFKALLIFITVSFQCNFSAIWLLPLFHCWVRDWDIRRGCRSLEKRYMHPGLVHSGLQKAIRSITSPRLTFPLSHPLCIIMLKEYLSPTVILALVYATGSWQRRRKKYVLHSSIIIIITLYFDSLYTICCPEETVSSQRAWTMFYFYIHLSVLKALTEG